jgi:hypothetical protein
MDGEDWPAQPPRAPSEPLWSPQLAAVAPAVARTATATGAHTAAGAAGAAHVSVGAGAPPSVARTTSATQAQTARGRSGSTVSIPVTPRGTGQAHTQAPQQQQQHAAGTTPPRVPPLPALASLSVGADAAPLPATETRAQRGDSAGSLPELLSPRSTHDTPRADGMPPPPRFCFLRTDFFSVA